MLLEWMWGSGVVPLLCGVVVACVCLVLRRAYYRVEVAVSRTEANEEHVLPTRRFAVSEAARIDFVRHGERLDHVDKGWCGSSCVPRTDPPLSPTGRLQAIETALHYRALRLSSCAEKGSAAPSWRLHTSPFLRCMQTAAVVSVVGFDGFDGVAVVVDERLGDMLTTKLYPHAAPATAGAFLPEGGGFQCRCPDVQNGVRLALSQLREHPQLLRRFHVKRKHLDRWEQLASALFLPEAVLPTFPSNPVWCPVYPETQRQFATRCKSAVLWRLEDDSKGHRGAVGSSKHDTVHDYEICVTHADVIRQTLHAFFPRVQHPYEAYSVPYCSVTSFSREQRAREQRRGNSVRGNAAPLATGPSALEWALNGPVFDAIGSTAHLAHSAVKLTFK